MDARTIACHLEPRERKLLAAALRELHEAKKLGTKKGSLSRKQMKKLFIVNATPFVGFGILDNMIMIFAGEYIDQMSKGNLPASVSQ
uniref:LETM1 domain-containing protein n=1 Tax=Steinernema glaseri TaxID=37863 RepID=A0A1I8ATJ4_9BILA